MKLRTLLAGLSACSLLAAPALVWAAALPPCTPAAMTPSATAVPANLPGFGYNALKATSSDVHLFATTSGGSRTEVALTVGPVEGGLLKVKPTAQLTPGTSYELEYAGFCNYSPYPAKPITFVAQPEAPLPTKVGDALAVPAVVLKDYGTTQYTITGSYSLAAEMKPWLGVYQLQIVLDGKATDTKPTINAAGDAVQVVGTGWCTDANGATKKHTIGLRGSLPFAPTLDTVSADLEFDCPGPKISTLPSNPPVQPPPGATPPGGGGTNGTGSNAGGNGGQEASGCSVGSTPTTSYLSSSSSTSFFVFITALFAVIGLIRRVNNDASAGGRDK